MLIKLKYFVATIVSAKSFGMTQAPSPTGIHSDWNQSDKRIQFLS